MLAKLYAHALTRKKEKILTRRARGIFFLRYARRLCESAPLNYRYNLSRVRFIEKKKKKKFPLRIPRKKNFGEKRNLFPRLPARMGKQKRGTKK